MQDSYTGDIGDYGKYALLRTLARSDLRLAVVWYLNPFEESKADGKFTSYLLEPNKDWYRPADPDVYDALESIVQDGRRRVLSVREARILPEGTAFHEAPLDYAKLPLVKDRRKAREVWLSTALNHTREANLVFSIRTMVLK